MGTGLASWFTGTRLTLLGQVVQTVPAAPPGMRSNQAQLRLWRSCGGPYDEIEPLLGLLTRLGLVNEQQSIFRRSQIGNRVSSAASRGDLKPLCLELVRAGYFHDQARILIESGEVDEQGNLHCATRVARAGAPQLVGVLARWEAVKTLPFLFVPSDLVSELDSVWALLPPRSEQPAWADERKAVGDRAEMYSVQRERDKVANKSAIVWVSRDSDLLGWDVEDRSVNPHRLIEVKGRRDENPVFYMSENEWRKAHEFHTRYEIHFWGGIDLNRDPSKEYETLRVAGYPLVLVKLAVMLDEGQWTATPVRWRIQRAAEDDAEKRETTGE